MLKLKFKREDKKILRIVNISIAGNFIIAIVKAITGILGNSYALIADAIESTADIFSSILIYFGLKYAHKPADSDHPYGHGKAEPLITFVSVAFLFTSAVLISVQSIQNIQTPHSGPKPYTLYVLILIIFLKEIFYRILNKKAKQVNSTTLHAEALHHRSDALTSLTALCGISISLIMGKDYENADDWAALIASFVIVYNTYFIFRPALGELMDENMHANFIDEIRLKAGQSNGVKKIEKCFVRKHGIYFYVDIHVQVNGNISVTEGHQIAHSVKDELMQSFNSIANVLVHIEPV